MLRTFAVMNCLHSFKGFCIMGNKLVEIKTDTYFLPLVLFLGIVLLTSI